MPTPEPSTSAFSQPAYVKLFTSRLLHNFAFQIVTTALTWQIYDITGKTIYLAYVGLAVFLPVLLFFLPSGYVSDHFNRRWVYVACLGLETLSSLGLVAFALHGGTALWLAYLCLTLYGTATSFGNPAASSLVPNLLTKEALPNGIAVNSMSWQTASVLGPTLGGLLVWISPLFAYVVATVMVFIGVLSVLYIGHVPQKSGNTGERTLTAMLAGFKFIMREPIVLGAISLDLFAVLLGGAVALLPVYAKDILHLDAWGNGLLRSATGIGAVLMGLWLAKFGIRDRAGLWMFLGVAFDGVVIVVFGYSVTAWISILMLALYGAFDMVSVYVRETLMQLWIPDHVRGRVNAVNNVFIGASNQLGEARAGFVAAYMGTLPAVVLGGLGTIFIACLWSLMFPTLRDQRKLAGKE